MSHYNTPEQELRVVRDLELQDCDWTQMPDSSLSDDKKEEWKTYRQKLRDLPATASPKISETGHLTNVTWPTKPE